MAGFYFCNSVFSTESDPRVDLSPSPSREDLCVRLTNFSPDSSNLEISHTHGCSQSRLAVFRTESLVYSEPNTTRGGN